MRDIQAVRVERVAHDGGPGKVVVAVVVEVVEGDGEGGEGLEVGFWVGETEEGCGAEGVDED